MRPIRLTMTAFGPYRDAETIDFDRLEDKRLFVISGNTGAGKTTIFDAICYALYDSASGEDRAETRMLRSHFAEEDVHTSVDFAFAVGKRTFRIFRQMKHRKGTNKSETGDRIEFYETTSGQEVPMVDRFMVKDVNDKVESILGLTKAQFSQIVMLPQGEFRKLLTSDTVDKEEILRHIFQTQLYERLEDCFQQMSRELKESHRDAKARLELQMKQVQETLPLREGSALCETLQQEVYNPAQVAQGLTIEADHYAELMRSAEEKKSAAGSELDQREAALRAALVLEGRYAELAAKREKRAELAREQGAMDERERQLVLAEQAARIAPYEEHASQAAREAAEKRRQAEVMRRQAEAAALELAQAEALYRAEEAREPERKQAELELARLKELAPAVQALGAQQDELAKLIAHEKEGSARLAELEQRLAANRQARQELTARIKEAETMLEAYPAKLEELERTRRQQKLLQDLVDLERKISSYSSLEAERERAVEQIRAEHDRLEQLWIEGQAGLLAMHLHDGQPCPVCGSAEHPNKAEASAQLPSREALQEAKDKLRHFEQELGTVRAQAAAARMALEAGTESLTEQCGSEKEAESQWAAQLATVTGKAQQLTEETGMLKQWGERLPLLRQEAEKLGGIEEACQREKDQLAAQLQSSAVEIVKRQSLLDKELERIPDKLRSPEELARHTAEQQRLADQLAESWRTAIERTQRLSTRAAEDKASSQQLAIQANEVEQKQQDAVQRFHKELTQAGFASEEAYKENRLPESTRLAYKLEIESFRQSLASLTDQINGLEVELMDKQKPDLELFQQHVDEAKLRLELILSELQTAERYSRDAERLLKAILSAQEHVREQEVRLEQVMDLYQTIKGDNPLKISFERYILIEFLEQILQAANVRLQHMSNGQFSLQRSDRLETRGKQSGLGLDVYDAYTGQNRDVKSLSGGEKFNASLCLALGMTDVIQAHQGGVSIEMMFIDEGFGTLDEDSLNKAIATLVDLQRSGRMIGVISHVQELKDAFPAVLEVRKTKEGYSRTEMIVK